MEADLGGFGLGLQISESATSRKDDLDIRRQVLRGGVEVSAFYQAQKTGDSIYCCFCAILVSQPGSFPAADSSMAWIISGLGTRGFGYARRLWDKPVARRTSTSL